MYHRPSRLERASDVMYLILECFLTFVLVPALILLPVVAVLGLVFRICGIVAF